ncbi:hypothetical protein VTK73DRAFT_9009 [Phialemonium thermophilum]|uniref:ubiquitinyl hydrolase 1 n=1 Tax=Phialemonium thermophilum TaxID=223376 RepID=A0ABR3W544_9PEZI
MIYNAVRFWKAYCRKNDSMVDRYWRGVLASGGECERCRIGSFAFQVTDITILPLTGPKLELRSLLAQYTLLEGTDNYNCTLCHQPKKRGTRFLRLPDRFAVCFQRFQNTEWGTGPEKDLRRVEFPLTDLDLGPYCVPLDTRLIQDDPEGVRMIEEDRHFRGPFIYDCYAVVCHVGSSISSGHYISYVRDHASEDPTDWYRFNDDVVTRVKVGASKRDELERMYRSGNQQAYLVFYKRRGT